MRPPDAALLASLLAAIIHTSAGLFAFTQPEYASSIPENARGKYFATPEPGQPRMGVPLPGKGSLRFKIVNGDPDSWFTAVARPIGDFAFLRIRTRPSLAVALNRELQDSFLLIVKATYSEEGRPNLETQAEVRLSITDQNDLVPLFHPSDYTAKVPESAALLSEIVRVTASDADEGLSGQVSYALQEPSDTFAVNPATGAILLLRKLDAERASSYELIVEASDRILRLFPDDPLSRRSPMTAQVRVDVIRSNSNPPAIAATATRLEVPRRVDEVLDLASISVSDEDLDDIQDVRLQTEEAACDGFFQLVPASGDAERFLLQTIPAAVFPGGLDACRLSVVATDAGFPPRNASLDLLVSVVPNRPGPLALRDAVLRLLVNESAPVGTPIGLVQATTSLRLRPAIRFELLGDQLKPVPFTVGERSGVISVAAPLDFEPLTGASFRVRAVDGAESAEVEVDVGILDANDHEPVFRIQPSNVAVSAVLESGAQVFTVRATDGDSGRNGKVWYRLANIEPVPFAVDRDRGTVTTTDLLEPNQSFVLRIRASDLGSPLRRETESSFTVRTGNATRVAQRRLFRRSIEGSNAKPPVFERSTWEAEVEEDAAIGTTLIVFEAKDPDTGYAGLVQYVLEPAGNAAGAFAVDTNSGALRLFRPLSDLPELPTSFRLTLTATDLGDPRKSSSTALTILVRPVASQPPHFRRPLYRVTVREDAPRGKELVTLGADGPRGMSFSLLAPADGDFRLDAQSGLLSVAKELDRERRPSYELRVRVEEPGRKSSEATVRITVEDVNDNAPRCGAGQTEQRVEVGEDFPVGALVSCLAAWDPDAGRNAALRFALSGSSGPFRLDAESGCVFVAGRLDFESRPLFNLSVEVSDSGLPSFTSLCPVLVAVVDVDENRHPPAFTDFALEASVYENEEVGTEVAKVTAVDPEDPETGPIYSILGPDMPALFSVDPFGIVRTRAVLDRESAGHYWVAVEARDRAAVPRTSTLSLYVAVLDRNDHAPLPSRPLYAAEIPEKSPPGTLVTRIMATDPDEEESGGIRYRISRGDPQSFFQINSLTGDVTTHRRKLDRERDGEQELEITITDSGTPKLTSTVLLRVSLSDKNDNAPVFQRQIYNINVPAPAHLASAGDALPLARVFASDDDVGANAELTYSLKENPDGLFAIAATTGALRATRALTPGEQYGVTVGVEDGGSPPLSSSTRVLLSVLPEPSRNKERMERNKAPTLLSPDPLELTLAADEAIGSKVALLAAEDEDGDQLWWELIGGDEEGVFSLRGDTGELQLARRPGDQGAYQLLYRVGDGLSSVEGQVDAVVLNGEGSRAGWSEERLSVSLAESTSVGSVVLDASEFLNRSSATGSLSGPSAITYFIHAAQRPASAAKFKMEPRTGRIILVENFDHELESEHQLTLGLRHRKSLSFASLTIKILDENDHQPEFVRKRLEARVAATAPIGTLVAAMTAWDRDSGLFGLLRYSIISGNTESLWSINSETGAVSVAAALSLDFPESLLVMKVEDSGPIEAERLSETGTLRILVAQAAASAPRFERESYALDASEAAPLGTQLVQLFAESGGGLVAYSLEAPAPPELAVHPVSGLLSLRGRLDAEARPHLNATVEARSPEGLVGKARIQLRVLDANDREPVFVEQVYDGAVREGAAPGTLVTRLNSSRPLALEATDADSGSNGMVSFALLDDWAKEFFAIDFGTGAIRTAAKLDYEKQSTYEFRVAARDLGSPPLQSIVPALVRVSVGDVNDEPPKLEPDAYSTTVFLPAAPGTVLVTLEASDADSTESLRFKLVGASPPGSAGRFSLNRKSGALRLTDTEGLKAGQSFSLEVAVSDGLNSASGSVHIKIASRPSSGLQFAKAKYAVSVKENEVAAEPTALVHVDLLGSAVGEKTVFRLLNPSEHFFVDALGGTLFATGQPLDREKTPNVTLAVEGRDERWPPRVTQTLVTVTVLDVNDSPPQFLAQPFHALIASDSEPGDVVAVVKAVDADVGRNGQVSYSVEHNANFVMDARNGTLSLKKAFPAHIRSRDVPIKVRATDAGEPALSATATVHVKVVNKAMPVFSSARYSVAVSESVEVGAVLASLSAQSKLGARIGFTLVDGDPRAQFDIDYVKGILTLRRRLDREVTDSYNLTVRATDIARSDIYSEVGVSISVSDVNDAAPRFRQASWAASVSEDAAVGTTLLRLSADDADLGANAELSFSLKGDRDGAFEMEESTGELRLRKQLDFETRKEYRLTAVVTDAGFPEPLSAEAPLVITVDDVNDHAPVFRSLAYSATIRESAEPSSFVQLVSAADPDDRPKLNYAILDGDLSPPLFNIEPSSGLIRLARRVPSELRAPATLALNLSVSDGLFTAYALLSAAVLPPEGEQSGPAFARSLYQLSLPENGAPGPPIAALKATGGRPPLRFSFGGEGGPAPFALEPDTGILRLSDALDYEMAKEHRLALVVADADGRRGFAQLVVAVQDRNDHRPAFVASAYAASVSANATRSSRVIDFLALDPDSGDSVEYSMFKDSASPAGEDIFKYFKLNRRRGHLTVKRSLTELAGKTFSMSVRATDRGNPPLQSQVPVTVTVLAADASVPVFSSAKYTFRISEDAVSGVMVSPEAQSGGIGLANGAAGDRFRLVAGPGDSDSPFSVEEKTGQIQLTDSLDFEKQTEHELVLSARNAGGAESLCRVLIKLHDVNDNAPQFLASYSLISIGEDTAVGSSVTVVSATDPDSGAAGKVAFSLRGPGANFFNVDAESGWLTLRKPLDRETTQQLEMEIIATDGGSPALSTKTKLKISLLDVNDNGPVFGAPLSRLSVIENAEAGTVIGRVDVADADSAPHNRLSLYILEGDGEGLFGIRETGDLYVIRGADYERTKEHRLKILASDGLHSATADVVVRIEDENDHAPACESDWASLSISEDAEVGAELFTLLADDADSAPNGIAKFRLHGHPERVFKIDSNGVIRLSSALDREKQDSFSFFARAVDAGGLFCAAQIRVSVLDVNDNAPGMPTTIPASVRENLDAGAHFVLRVGATDPDLGPGGRLQFAIEDKGDAALAEAFWMDELSGALSVRKPLDREDRAYYNISVVARDGGGLESRTTVLLSVLDENDNPPEFLSTEVEAAVSEGTTVGTRLGKVEALGKDVADQISYALVGPPEALDVFSVDPDNGEIHLVRALDFEEQATWVLIVEAVEEGGEELRAEATFTLTLIDVNDNPPKFAKTLYTADLNESAAVGERVLQIVAADPDSKNNGRVTYRFAGDTEQDLPFRLDDKGWLIVSGPLDREKRLNYKLVAEAWDGGRPSLSDTAALEITLLDVNDNPPKFASCNLTASVVEGKPAGTYLLGLELTDADNGGNGGPFSLGVVGKGGERFAFTADGALVTAAPLTYADANIYLLSVRATDGGTPALSTECPLTVHVAEESKYAPVLGPMSVRVLAYLGEFPGGLLATAVASDRDPRDVLTYRLLPGGDAERLGPLISLDESSGRLSGGRGLQAGDYVLNVSASDGRFTTFAPFLLSVGGISEVELNFAVSMRLAAVAPPTFVQHHMRDFEKAIAKAMSVRNQNVKILSIQEAVEETEPSRKRRVSRKINSAEDEEEVESADLDVLFAVRKGGRNAGFFRPNAVRRRLEARGSEIGVGAGGLEVLGLRTEVCRRDSCLRGQCMDRLGLDDAIVLSASAGGAAFVAPAHKREAVCMCQQGYGGGRCDVAVNGCSREPCGKWELCVPLDSAAGYRCHCPPGKTGPICADPIACEDGDTCDFAVLRLNGNGYAAFSLSTQFERRLELALEIRTMARDGVLLYSGGPGGDFQTLEVQDGYVQYRWDCGSGEGIARLHAKPVTDGLWHRIQVTRRGKDVRLTLDQSLTASAESPGTNAILNLRESSLVVGAVVRDHPSLYGHRLATKGFVGCLRGVEVDGFRLPVARSSARLHSLDFGCLDSFISGVCSTGPCRHFGRCEADPLNEAFLCRCEERYTGSRCEVDLDACADAPCYGEASCENRFNDFVCRCPRGFRGKTCREEGSATVCDSSPCGVHGDCGGSSGAVVCSCRDGWTGSRCEAPPPTKDGPQIITGPFAGIGNMELIIIGVVVLLLIILACCIACCCRCHANSRRRKAGYSAASAHEPAYDTHPHHINNQLHQLTAQSKESDPPPLPPRSRIQRNSKLSNLESAHQTGLPTAQVPPLSFRASPRSGWRGAPKAAASNLASCRSYGSAAEELEALAKEPQLADLIQSLAKPTAPPTAANLRSTSSGESSGASGGRDEDWKANLHLLSLDSIERLKREAEEAEAQHDAPPPRPPHSNASIHCLPEDQGYHWDYSDWNSTLGDAGGGYSLGRGESEAPVSEDGEAPLPVGVSALEDTDSEAPMEEEELRIPPLAPSDFAAQLMAMQRLPGRTEEKEEEPEDEYVTMRPLGTYQRHLDKYLPRHHRPSPPSLSQRRPLLSSAAAEPSDASSGDEAPPRLGFPKLSLHTYDLPPYALARLDQNRNAAPSEDAICPIDDDEDPSGDTRV